MWRKMSFKRRSRNQLDRPWSLRTRRYWFVSSSPHPPDAHLLESIAESPRGSGEDSVNQVPIGHWTGVPSEGAEGARLQRTMEAVVASSSVTTGQASKDWHMLEHQREGGWQVGRCAPAANAALDTRLHVQSFLACRRSTAQRLETVLEHAPATDSSRTQVGEVWGMAMAR